ncbi:M48 family metalloprotease [Lentibacter algarum]|uniref:M48 family metalloprotease n=1 Tax=Lentibacter algarum TaxID=576131 RepID=UPI001C0872D9|nr:M48 family metalloprotease [Lentibacter algarum]MBU2982720.1 M48 family metalloprotease [Lentibacter algarum]
MQARRLFQHFAVFLALALVLASPARAVSLLRDPDIEHALRQVAKPVLDAAGLPSSRIRILVVNESSLNAFVIDRDHIFIHQGLILRLKTAEELQAVIAHEAAHIANGHLARRPVNARHAKTLAGFGLALAAAAAASGNPEAGAAIGLGTTNAAMRGFFAHTRAEEASADQSALRYMARGGVDPQGAVRVMELFSGQELLSANRQDPYARSHPLSRDRLRAMKAGAATLKPRAGNKATSAYWFARAQGKLSAFTRAPKWTLRRAGDSGHKDIAQMRRAIAWSRSGKANQAFGAMNKLIASSPKDPYLYELKGQLLLEKRQYKAAVAAYKNAVSLAPRDALVLGAYGHALLVSGNPKAALPQLERSIARDRRDARTMRDLGGAYARLGNAGMASLLTAERYALLGRMKDAGIHAKRATSLLKRGSPGWQRAQDVLVAAQTSRRKK